MKLFGTFTTGLVGLLIWGFCASFAWANFSTASQAFNTLTDDRKVQITIGLIATGDFSGVYNGEFNQRLETAIEAFQSREGFLLTGVLLPNQTKLLDARAAVFLRPLALTTYQLDSGAKLLVPRALFDTEQRTGWGYAFERTDNMFSLTFETVPNLTFEDLYSRFASNSVSRSVSYKVLRSTYFVSSGLYKGKSFYTWFDRASGSPTGFTLSWAAERNDIAHRLTILLANEFTPVENSSTLAQQQSDETSTSYLKRQPNERLCYWALDYATRTTWDANSAFSGHVAESVVSEAKRRGLSIDGCRVALGLPSRFPQSGSEQVTVDRVQREQQKLFDERERQAAVQAERNAVLEAQKQKNEANEKPFPQEQKTTSPPEEDLSELSYSVNFICREALAHDNKAWDTDQGHWKFIEEAKRRGLSVNDCRVAFGLSQLPVFQANVNSILQNQSNKPVCFWALDYATKTTWETNSIFSEHVAEAKRRELSIDDCRLALGLQKNPTNEITLPESTGNQTWPTIATASKGDFSFSETVPNVNLVSPLPPNFVKPEVPSWVDTRKRVALVIGNSNYLHVGKLPNTRNDADLITKTLEQTGFKVTKLIDADQVSMKQAMVEFGRELRKGVEASLFFYAGHGVQVKGENYLIPVDAAIKDESEVGFLAVGANEFLQTMEGSSSQIRIVVLDACRDNPFPTGLRSITRGLAPVGAPLGIYVAYSTAPGQVAEEGRGTNSPYTAALAEFMLKPGLRLEDVFKQTRKKVLQETSSRQIPWEEGSLIEDFYFLPTATSKNSGESGRADSPMIPESQQPLTVVPDAGTALDQATTQDNPSGTVAPEPGFFERLLRIPPNEAARSPKPFFHGDRITLPGQKY